MVTVKVVSVFFFFQSMLIDYAGFFLVPLTSRLVNDDSAGCRKLTALAIKSLLEKVINWIERVCGDCFVYLIGVSIDVFLCFFKICITKLWKLLSYVEVVE